MNAYAYRRRYGKSSTVASTTTTTTSAHRVSGAYCAYCTQTEYNLDLFLSHTCTRKAQPLHSVPFPLFAFRPKSAFMSFGGPDKKISIDKMFGVRLERHLMAAQIVRNEHTKMNSIRCTHSLTHSLKLVSFERIRIPFCGDGVLQVRADGENARENESA